MQVHDMTGIFMAWIDVGAPSAERLHKASKAARRVALFTHVDATLLLREARSRPVHKLEAIEVTLIPAAFLESVEASLERRTALEITRTSGALYVTIEGKTHEGQLTHLSLAE